MMRLGNPIWRLARVVLLAAMGFLLAAGTAAAHSGHKTASSDQAQVIVKQVVIHQTATHIASSDAAGSPASMPCSEDDGVGHSSSGCCTIACHAALAAAAITPIGSAELPFHRIVSLTDMLVGRSTDRAERPPKAG